MIPVAMSSMTLPPQPVDASVVEDHMDYIFFAKEEADKEVDRIIRQEEIAEIRLRIAKRKKEEAKRKHIGEFYITAYAATGNPCANGNYPTVGKTIACNSLPMGTKVYIEGIGERIVEDRGASWHVDNWIDLYLGETQTCINWGKQELNVYIID